MSQIGTRNRKFARLARKAVTDIFGGRNSPALSERNVAMFCKKYPHLTKPGKSGERPSVNEYSPWLAKFVGSGDLPAERLEIPGQYEDLSACAQACGAVSLAPCPRPLLMAWLPAGCAPDPDMHVRVVTFNRELLLMASIRKPKRIKLNGNDEKEYPFLAKGGEDLRLDQRIQTMFRLMNKLLRANPEAQRRHLHIKTYNVRAHARAWLRTAVCHMCATAL